MSISVVQREKKGLPILGLVSACSRHHHERKYHSFIRLYLCYQIDDIICVNFILSF